jgi:cytochrome b6-f complex iron-sulfur subunit
MTRPTPDARSSSVQPAQGPATSAAVLRAARGRPAEGLSRRSLLRRALGVAMSLAAVQAVAGTIGFLWPNAARAGGRVAVGTYDALLLANGDLPIGDGFPAYVAEAKAFVVIVDPTRGGWSPGSDLTGDGTALNVRALSQRCPHLGCRPNPCLEDFWMHCPCHQSRYDRLGTKAEGEAYGPATRGMDRFAIEVDASGVLTIDTTRLVLGPLPVALGAAGLLPPLVDGGCGT